MDSNLKRLDSVVQLQVKDKDLATPPGSPANGDRYIVAGSPTGAWSGHAKDIAVYEVSTWVFYTPKDGWIAWVADESVIYVYSASAWTKYAGVLGGTAKFVSFPCALFGSKTVSQADPFADDGAYDYIALPAAGDNKLATYFVCPHDYVATGSWKVLWATGGTSTTAVTCYLGINEYNSGGTEDPADPCVLGSPNAALTPTGVNNRIVISSVAVPSITLTPGKLYKLHFRRMNAEDANPDDMKLLALLWTYTT